MFSHVMVEQQEESENFYDAISNNWWEARSSHRLKGMEIFIFSREIFL